MWPLLLACTSASTPEITAEAPLDLTERLASGWTRAGVVDDERALLGGISAEGALGDVKIYNDRAAFIIQGVRDSSYYVDYGGAVIDADITRPDDQPGRDMIDDTAAMVGMGRLVDPTEIAVLSDGRLGTASIVRVTGVPAPMLLLEGALEAPGFIGDAAATITTDYILAPDTPLLEMHTTITWEDDETSLSVGDIIVVSDDVSAPWRPGMGLETDSDAYTARPDWLGVVADRGEQALALMAETPGGYPENVFADLLSEIGPVMAGQGSSLSVATGETIEWRRYLGVGPDLATLTDAWTARVGVDTAASGGAVVDDAGEAVAGARVHLLDSDGAPWTQAITDDDGRWSAQVPAGEAMTAVATGVGRGISCDLPEGAGWYSPYSGAVHQDAALDSLLRGAAPIPEAVGRGASEPANLTEDTLLTLGTPGTLSVDTGDGLPAVVRLDPVHPVTVDRALASSWPDGAAWLYLRDGSGEITVPAGDYNLTAHRGVQWEIDQQTVAVTAGEETEISVTLTRAYRLSEVVTVDPHSHAGPSGDGGIAMAERLVVHAAHNIQVHVGTDHDHVADYRPLVTALGLDDVLRSVVADEVSPVLRGHFNAFPATPDTTAANHGAPRWWANTWDTAELFAEIRAALGDDVLIQANHPTGSSGLFGYADYDTDAGEIGSAEHWSEDFDLMEVLNDGEYADFLPYYLDLTSRGFTITPTGVSDSHGHRSGVGENRTLVHVSGDPGPAVTDEQLTEALQAQATVVSRGPAILATVGGVWAPGQTFTGAVDLDVSVYAPSWMPLDTLELLENGAVVQTVELSGTAAERGSAVFSLTPTADAHYIVIASGAASMHPVYSETAWAMTAALKVDVAGDGWEAPLPALTVAR